MLYNKNTMQDIVYVLKYINDLTKELGIEEVWVDTDAVFRVVEGSKQDFPHIDGIDKASAFKLIANFVCYFVAERPIKSAFPASAIGEKLAKVENHQNAIVAFSLARTELHKAKIFRDDKTFEVKEEIKLSGHSYCDIVEALANLSPSSHFKLVTVLFEQLVYKTNPECQYELS